MGTSIADLIACANALIDAITFDDSGIMGQGGNGGLISRSTILKTDELRMIISKMEKKDGDLPHEIA